MPRMSLGPMWSNRPKVLLFQQLGTNYFPEKVSNMGYDGRGSGDNEVCAHPKGEPWDEVVVPINCLVIQMNIPKIHIFLLYIYISCLLPADIARRLGGHGCQGSLRVYYQPDIFVTDPVTWDRSMIPV